MDKIKGKLEGKRHEFIHKWEEKSREFINSFLDMFGKDGRLVSCKTCINFYISLNYHFSKYFSCFSVCLSFNVIKKVLKCVLILKYMVALKCYKIIPYSHIYKVAIYCVMSKIFTKNA